MQAAFSQLTDFPTSGLPDFPSSRLKYYLAFVISSIHITFAFRFQPELTIIV